MQTVNFIILPLKRYLTKLYKTQTNSKTAALLEANVTASNFVGLSSSKTCRFARPVSNLT